MLNVAIFMATLPLLPRVLSRANWNVTGQAALVGRYIEKLTPQPQLEEAFGLSITKRADQFFAKIDGGSGQKRQGNLIEDNAFALTLEDEIIVFGRVERDFILKSRAAAAIHGDP
jgi:hypothetical protein